MEPFLGQIQSLGFSFAPVGWMHCNGDLISIAENSALFALLGTTYGGDGQSTFALPDLRGRVMVNQGNGGGLTPMVIGQMGGSEQTTLTIGQMPAHNHGFSISVNSNATGEENTPSGKLAKKTGAYNEDSTTGAFHPVVQQTVGSGSPFGLRNPFLGIYHAIAIEGIFPSRS